MESTAISRGLLVPIVSVAVGWVVAILMIVVYQDRFPGIKKATYFGVIISALVFMVVMFARQSLATAMSVGLGLTLGQVIGLVRRARRSAQPRAND